jgi:PAS domain S-box-containing protein
MPNREPADDSLATLRHELENERRQSRLIAAFFEDAARAAADDRSVFQVLAERVAEGVGDGCLVSLTSDDGEWLELAGVHAPDPIKVAQTRAATARRRLDSTIYANVVRTGRPLFLPSVDRENLGQVAEQFNADQLKLLTDFGVRAVIVIPLILGGKIAGVVVASRTESSVPYTPSDLEVLEALAARATLVLDNAKTHRDLQAASTRLQTIISESPIATVVLNAEHRIELWGQASQDLLGWTDAEVIGRPLPTTPPGLEAEAMDLHRRLREGETVRGQETKVRARDGREISVALYAAPLQEDSAISGSVLRWVDLSERLELEARLDQAQRLESVGRLAGGIAHDFNNILTAILGFTDLIQQDVAENDAQHGNVRAIRDAAERATRLGYTVLLAADGPAAMEIARSTSIDLLLTDVVMPGQSGFDLATDLREISPTTRVLMMSGYTSAALEPHGLVDGDKLLQKPFTPASLGQAVREALSGPAA